MRRARSPWCRNEIDGTRCGRPEDEHVNGGCPRDPTRKFSLLAFTPTRVSNSFSEASLDWLNDLIRTGLRGGDVRVLMRHPECGKLLTQVTNMRATIDRQKQARQEHGPRKGRT